VWHISFGNCHNGIDWSCKTSSSAPFLCKFINLLVLVCFGDVFIYTIYAFQYMVVLFILFVIQFAIACACLAVNSDTQVNCKYLFSSIIHVKTFSLQKTLAEAGWTNADNATIADVQKAFQCCGFHNTTDSGRECSIQCPNCPTCESALENMINYGFRVSGGIGLFFSFTEVNYE